MHKLSSLLILLILFHHTSLFCVKRKSVNRIIKRAEKLKPIDVPPMIANYLNNAANLLSARQQLELAIEKGDMQVAKILLSSHSSRLANACLCHGNSNLIEYAMFRDKPIIFSLLLKAGAVPENIKKKSLLFDAVFTVRAECVQRLLEDGYADPNVIVVSHNPRHMQGTPLHYNSYNLGIPVQALTTAETLARKIKIAEFLLDHGADRTIKDSSDKTAIEVLDQQQERVSANQLKQFLLYYNPKRKIA